MDLDSLRKKIDELDARLVQLLNERAKCATEIGKIKAGQRLPIYEPRREQTVFDNVRRLNAGPLPDADVIQVYERIIDVMRKIQREEIAPEPPPSRGSELEEND